ncbi:MAG: DUF748 domain-containing protein [Alistipes sp.]|nr:DUF748 domain-containing protein [Alistipes sp.]
MKAELNDVVTNEEPKPRRKWGFWRIMLTTLGAIVALLFVVLAVAIIWLGPIAEKYVENHDTELIGRSLTMDNLSIKLFSGDVAVDNLVLYEEDCVAEFVRIDRFETKLSVWDLLSSLVQVDFVRVQSPKVQVLQGEESFNFDSLVDYILATYTSEEEPEEESEPSAWTISINNVSLEGGEVLYRDETIDQDWSLTALNVSTPSVELGEEPMVVALSTAINQEGALDGELNFNMGTLDFIFDGRLSNFNLADTYNYLTSTLNISALEGTLSVDCSLKGNVDDVMAMNIEGNVLAKSMKISAKDGSNLFSAETIDLTAERLNLDEQLFAFSTIAVDNYATRFALFEDGTTNFDELFFSDPEISVESTAESVGDQMYDVKERVTVTTSEEEAPFEDVKFSVGTLRFRGGEVSYEDYTMHEPFTYALSNLSVDSKGFELMSKNRIIVRSRLPKQGDAMIQWEGSLTDFYNQSILAMLSNVDMQAFSTYVEHFTAFPVESGNMTIRSQNVVTNGALSGVNQFGTYNFQVGDKDKSLDVEYKLPMKLGIYVLTDHNKHIDLDIPISGDINSPEFSLRKVIWRAVGNVLLKVAASPFQWMNPLKQETFQSVPIDILALGLDSEDYARIDAMAEAIKADTTLKVRLTPRVNYKRAVQKISDLNLKIAYYNATEGSQSGFLDMLDFARINDMKISGSAVRDFADSMLVARGIDPHGMTSHDKAKRLYGDMADEQLLRLISQRNNIVSRYVAFQHKELPADAFTLKDVTIESLKEYLGKDKYGVSLIIGDDEVEVDAPEKEEAEEVAEGEETPETEEVVATEEQEIKE